MSLSFLFPWMWLATASVAVPLWLHFRRRDESRIVHFSAMRFLEDQPLARRRPILPREVPLLLLRLLLLLLLVTAFAWPFLPGRHEVLIRESRVYILDNTLSHQAGNRFVAARDTIADALSESGVETQIAVVELTGSPRVLVEFGDDPGVVSTRVRELRPACQRGSYAEAFRLAQTLVDQGMGENRRIVFLGDSQQNQWQEDQAVTPFLECPHVDLPDPIITELPNLALREPSVQRAIVADQTVIQCAVRVYAVGGPQAAQIAIKVNDRIVSQRPIKVAGHESEQTELLDFTWEDDSDQWLRGEIRLMGHTDALAVDDRVFFSLPPVRAGRVAYLAESLYLRTALSPTVLDRRWTGEPLAEDAVRSGNLADVLCLESDFLTSRKVRQLVLDYVRGGRGVALFVGRNRPVVTAVLREFGIKMGMESPAASAETGFRYLYLDHPILRPFRASDFGDLSDVRFYRFRRLQVRKGVPLAFSETGDPLLTEITLARGRMLVFAFKFDRADTSWPLHPSFLPFLDRSLQHLRADNPEMATTYPPGGTCVYRIPPDRDAAQVVISARDPAGKDTRRLPVADRQAQFPLPDLPGHYEVRFDADEAIQAVLNVNTPPAESELIFNAKPDTLIRWRKDSARAVHDDSRPASADNLARHEILRQPYWWWLIAAGLAALVVETAWISRAQGAA